MRKILNYKCLFFALFISLSMHQLYAAEAIVEDIPLNFGTIALIDNSAQYTLQITMVGGTVNDPQIVIISPGNAGQYSLSGFPANTLVNIGITTATGFTQLAGFTNPASEQFQVLNFSTTTPVNTDSNGEKTIQVGATLKTSGVGSYMDAMYIIFMNVTVSY